VHRMDTMPVGRDRVDGADADLNASRQSVRFGNSFGSARVSHAILSIRWSGEWDFQFRAACRLQ
jgi:hypothetical protein